ncbi:MAG TPA: peptidoglycan editing factor PgeF [Clostridiales bacterium]|nr:peptidoglycan editing factor PgeF [Clostridiales bacterium]HOL90709.1 peptidoglycan editing factor PgeF [Clostridiales bacterium]HPP35398.1 peptidoglycan editing factor PgeF [Clostridiales bacterium]
MKEYEKIGTGTVLVTDGHLKYIEFESLNKYKDMLTHFMSTRHGGVSSGECSTLNLGFGRNDDRDNVIENFRIICNATAVGMESLVLTNQVHGTKVCRVDEGDIGKGLMKESDLKGTDGLITTAPGVTMVTFHADCSPVFLFEPSVKAAALLHSGWKGTLADIVTNAISEMKKIPGFDAGRVEAVIGPSIGFCCFEVDEDVYMLFREKYDNDSFYCRVSDRKWKIDLKGIIKARMAEAGVDTGKIHDSGICTKCRSDLFFSYRGDMGRTGSMAAFMQIRQ